MPTIINTAKAITHYTAMVSRVINLSKYNSIYINIYVSLYTIFFTWFTHLSTFQSYTNHRIMARFVPRSNAEQILQSYNIILFVLNKYKFYLN